MYYDTSEAYACVVCLACFEPRIRPLPFPPSWILLIVNPNMKNSRKPTSRNFPDAAKSRRKKHKGISILFEGVCYQSLAAFAKEYGFHGSNGKNLWFQRQLSKQSLNDRLRFLRGESLKSIGRAVPKGVRDGKVDAKNMHKLFVPANRKRNTGNAGLFKSTVLE